MKNKITRRLTLYFTAVLMVFALIAGVLFSLMFARHNVQVLTRDLQAHAASISETLSHFMANYHEGTCTGGGFKSYTRFVSDLALSDLYLIDAGGSAVTIGEQDLPDNPLPPEARPLVDRVFESNSMVSESFSFGPFHTGSLVTGAPVRDAQGQALYALILHYPVDVVDHSLRDTLYILSACLCISMVLAVAISHILSRRFAMPLHRMMDMTTKLMAGDYRAKTGICQDDEIGILASHIDELSQKLDAVEQERKQLDQMRQNFFSDISHELRTPIAILKGNIELLRDGVVQEPERQAAYRQLYADANHIQHLVNDLLELTRLQNPHFSIQMDVVNLADVLSDTVRSMRQQAAAKQIEISLHNAVGPFPVLGDYARLRQLMIILLDNAIKFSPEHADILISAAPVSGGCEVCITDHGVGFDSETLRHIFDRYYHSHSVRNRGGTGLGLPIAKEIALRHQLSFTCESEVGKGSRFSLVFPMHKLPEN